MVMACKCIVMACKCMVMACKCISDGLYVYCGGHVSVLWWPVSVCGGL